MNTRNNTAKIDPDVFASASSQLTELLQEYFSRSEDRQIKPSFEPGKLSGLFHKQAPTQPIKWDELLHEVRDKILPGVTDWQNPRFMAFYPANTSVPAILADQLITAIGSVGLQWSSNPIGTELECIVMDWLAQMLHCDDHSEFLHASTQGGGYIQSTAGEGLAAIATAARVQCHIRQQGFNTLSEVPASDRSSIYYRDSSKFVAYMSDQTHFSGIKAARVASIRCHIIKSKLLPDGNYGIDQQDIIQAIERDRHEGLIPCYIQLNYGSTNTCGFDDLDSWEVDKISKDIWIHVDAAYGGASLILEKYADRSRTIQRISTSFNINGSKWLLCGFDSAFFFVKNRHLLMDCFSATGDYLDPSVPQHPYTPQFKDWSVPLGRKFRSLRIWMVLCYFGQEGLRNFLSKAITEADILRKWIDESEEFEQTVSTELGLVCFHPKERAKTQSLVNDLNSSDESSKGFLIFPSMLNDQPFIRVALGGINTSLEDVKILWDRCCSWSQQNK